MATLGRPKTGKRSDPNWSQCSLYLENEVHRDAKIKAIRDGVDLSSVTNNLLAAYVDGAISIVKRDFSRELGAVAEILGAPTNQERRILLACDDAAAATLGGDGEYTAAAVDAIKRIQCAPFAEQQDFDRLHGALLVDVKGMLYSRFGVSTAAELKAANISGRQAAEALVSELERRFGRG